jgi:signal transduction histidine kinase
MRWPSGDHDADVRRVVYALRPPSLDELGLIGALRQTVDNDTTGPLQLVVDLPEQLPPLPAAVEVAAYRIAQEALTNVVRHAAARTCTLRVAVDASAHLLKVLVEDDGSGLPHGYRKGVGLHSMRERAAELGGSCEIGPGAEGGTRV